jgi:hypothetical protein
MLKHKLGDNINYNLEISKALYANKNQLFNKPKILINVSIIEAIMYDFIEKASTLTREGMNLNNDAVEYLKSKEVNKFDKIIAQFKKHKIIEVEDFDLIENLKILKKVRNRIHIQNDKKENPKDDIDVFSDDNLLISEKVLELIMKVMSKDHIRSDKSDYIGDYNLPFNEHFKKLNYKIK